MQTETYREFKIEISQDEQAENPREGRDHVGKMVCFHNKYNLGDKHNFSSEEYEAMANNKSYIVLPLYLFDHSGITMSTAPFSCQWDSGRVGWIQCKKGFENLTDENIEKILESEVEEYDKFLTGDVWGFNIEKLEN